MSAAPPFDGFEEREQPALGRSLALALAVHLVLFAILFVGIRWESHPPTAMVVELWPAMPEPASKPAPKVEPPPPPKPKPVQKVEPLPPPPPKVVPKPEPRIEKPDIAIKAPPKPKAEPKPKPPPPKLEPKPKPKPREDVMRKQMQEQLAQEQRQMQEQLAQEQRRISAQIQDAELRDLLARDAAASRSKALAAWADEIRERIRRNIVLPPGIQGNPEALFAIDLLPTGEVLNVRVSKSSGLQALDDAIYRAILKSSPLPKPKDPSVFERRLELTYRPKDQ